MPGGRAGELHRDGLAVGRVHEREDRPTLAAQGDRVVLQQSLERRVRVDDLMAAIGQIDQILGVLHQATELALGVLEVDEEAGVRHGQADLRRHRCEELEILFGKPAVRVGVNVQGAGGLEVGAQRHRDETAQPLVACGLMNQPWVVLQAPDDNRFPGLNDPARDALANFDVANILDERVG